MNGGPVWDDWQYRTLHLPILCYMIRAEGCSDRAGVSSPQKGLIHVWVFST